MNTMNVLSASWKVFMVGCALLLTMSASSFGQEKGTIISPSNGQNVTQYYDVSGTCNQVPTSRRIWLFVKPQKINRYYMQSMESDSGPNTVDCSSSGKNWESGAYFGASPEKNIGEQFELILISVDVKDSDELRTTLVLWNEKSRWPGLPALPSSAKELSKVVVKRIRG